jgi:hypothetical protein
MRKTRKAKQKRAAKKAEKRGWRGKSLLARRRDAGRSEGAELIARGRFGVGEEEDVVGVGGVDLHLLVDVVEGGKG